MKVDKNVNSTMSGSTVSIFMITPRFHSIRKMGGAAEMVVVAIPIALVVKSEIVNANASGLNTANSDILPVKSVKAEATWAPKRSVNDGFES